jgi:transcriptional regulator with XRE-family HTH domain
MPPTTFGQQLRRSRETRGLTQQQLADRANVSPIMISHFETGSRPSASADTLVKLADALDVTIDYLLGRSDSMSPETGEVALLLRSLARSDSSLLDAAKRVVRSIADTQPQTPKK